MGGRDDKDGSPWKPIDIDYRQFIKTIDRLRTIISDLQGLLIELERIAGVTDVATPPKEKERLLRLLWLIRQKGNVVSEVDLYNLARKVGYDTRGLGALYRAGYIEKIAGNKIALTQDGEQELKRYENWLKYHEKIF